MMDYRIDSKLVDESHLAVYVTGHSHIRGIILMLSFELTGDSSVLERCVKYAYDPRSYHPII